MHDPATGRGLTAGRSRAWVALSTAGLLLAASVALLAAPLPAAASSARAASSAGVVARAGAYLDVWWQSALASRAAVPPYRTQLDGSRYAGSNCGPAVLGMALEGYGVGLDTLELRRLTHTYQGTWPGRGGTALQHIARVAEDVGLQTHGLYDAPDAFHPWSVEEIVQQVERGRWVVPLVRYGALPGHEASGVRYGHYVLLYAREGSGFRYHDPAFRPVEEGPGRWIGDGQLEAAMGPVLVPRQAVAFGP